MSKKIATFVKAPKPKNRDSDDTSVTKFCHACRNTKPGEAFLLERSYPSFVGMAGRLIGRNLYTYRAEDDKLYMSVRE